MSYTLNAIDIRRPASFSESNSTQSAQNRTLDGSISRDYFGDNKRVWKLSYKHVNSADYLVIKSIYQGYLSNPEGVTWQVSETNYTIAETHVHVDLVDRGFSVKGTSYLSDFELILTET